MTRVPPSNVEAEASLIGAALLRQPIVGLLAGVLDPSDFYKPFYGHVWQAMIDLHATGHPIDVVTVGQRLGALNDSQALLECQNATPSISAAPHYAEMIIETSRRRRLMMHHLTMAEQCYDQSADDVLASDDPKADRLILPRGADMSIDGLVELQEFVTSVREVEAQGEWLLPHIFRPKWRAIVVAGEGVGKGTLMRFLGLHAAAGRDPWAPSNPIIPRRVLYIDVENPDTAILHQINLANASLDLVDESEGRYHMWCRESGLNFRDRRVQAEMESVLQQVRPEMVFAGPLYKMFRRKGSEDMEQATIELLEVLDDFRRRFGFSLMLEHHAPKGGPGYRDLNPFGSSALLRWPEFGLTLEPVGNPLPHETRMVCEVNRFRKDRLPCDWPTTIERGALGQRAAWRGTWPMGRNHRGL